MLYCRLDGQIRADLMHEGKHDDSLNIISIMRKPIVVLVINYTESIRIELTPIYLYAYLGNDSF